MAPTLIPFTLLMVLRPETNTPLALALGCPMSLWFLGCAAANVVLWTKLLWFRCPRCCKRFIRSKNATFPGDACGNCGLRVGA